MLLVFDKILPPNELSHLSKLASAELDNNANTVLYRTKVEFKDALDRKHIRANQLNIALDYINNMARGMLSRLYRGEQIYSDPAGRGCGVHRLPIGGYLGLHVDGNWHPDLQKLRFANAVFYLQGDNSSPFYLRDHRIEFVPNRLVIFTVTEDDDWHGVPDPIQTKDRLTLSTFFYKEGDMPDHPRRAKFLELHTKAQAQRATL